MLKKSGALLLILLYTVTVYGFALNLHYCGKLLTSVNIDAPSKNCGMLMEGKMKCCKDKQIKVKVKDVHQATSTSFVAKTAVFTVPQLPYGNYFVAQQQQIATALLNKAPPDVPLLPISVFDIIRTLL
jgi:hypothetical protein